MRGVLAEFSAAGWAATNLTCKPPSVAAYRQRQAGYEGGNPLVGAPAPRVPWARARDFQARTAVLPTLRLADQL